MIQSIVTLLSRMPAPVKGRTLFKIGGKLSSYVSTSGDPEMIRTNLGIRNDYLFSMPGGNPQFAFGNPMTYRGERGVLYLAKHLAPAVDAVMDVGANWGYFTYFLRPSIPDNVPIYFFEPNDKLFDTICENIQKNNFRNIHGVKKGIAGSTGTASFFVNLTNDLSSTLDNSFVQPGEKVVEQSIEVVTFDDFVSEHEQGKEWLVKVDIENAEPEFIKGAAEKMGQVKYLIIEFLEKARKAKLADQLTHDFGLNAFYINDFTLEYMPKEDGRYTPPEYNFLFCRESPAELAEKLKQSPFSVQK